MTALDQAFIKAFSQQCTPAAAIPPQRTAPAAKQPPSSSNSFDGVLAALEKPPGRAPELVKGGRRSGRTEKKVRGQGPGAGVRDQGPGVRDQGRVVGTRPDEEHVTPPDCGPGGRKQSLDNLPPIEVGSEQWATSTEQWAVGTEQWALGSGQWLVDGERQTRAQMAHPPP